MTKNNKGQTLKGFRDFPPKKMRVRNAVVEVLTETFESFGFSPVQTPSLEYQETLLGKYGEEADRLVYTFKDKGERDVGLIYDLTVPISRFMAANQDLPKPFKRYQIQKVWRADKPQKGRYREFTQCDVDSFGSPSPLADAEIVTVIDSVMKKLRFSNYTIRLNSRQVLFDVLNASSIDPTKQMSVLQTIDKLDKKSEGAVIEELGDKGFDADTINTLFDNLDNAEMDQDLKKIFEYTKTLGVNEATTEFDPTLARGLDYYTGPIFEVVLKKPEVGSVAAGGRYDELIGGFSGENIPATGVSFGLDRICDVIEELGLPIEKNKVCNVLVTIFNPDLAEQSLKILTNLKDKGIRAEIYIDPKADLKKQLKYADKNSIPYAVIAGPVEIENNVVKLKNMDTGEQKALKPSEIPSQLL